MENEKPTNLETLAPVTPAPNPDAAAQRLEAVQTDDAVPSPAQRGDDAPVPAEDGTTPTPHFSEDQAASRFAAALASAPPGGIISTPTNIGRPRLPAHPDPRVNQKRAIGRLRRSKKYLTDLPVGNVRFDDSRKILFLQHYAGCGMMIQSALAAGVCDNTVRESLKRDRAFAEAYEFAALKFKEKLEAEAMRRGHDGWMEPVVQKGQVVHHDCEACRGFGRVIPPDSKLTILEVPERERYELPMCTDCGGTGKGAVVYSFKADSQVFQKLLARHIPEYREKIEVDQKVSGGVLVVGAPPVSTDDWNAQWAGKRAPVLDADFEANTRPSPATPLPTPGTDAPIPSEIPAEPVSVERRSGPRTGSGTVTVRR